MAPFVASSLLDFGKKEQEKVSPSLVALGATQGPEITEIDGELWEWTGTEYKPFVPPEVAPARLVL